MIHLSFLPGLNRVPNRPTAPLGAGHGVGRVPAGVREAYVTVTRQDGAGLNVKGADMLLAPGVYVSPDQAALDAIYSLPARLASRRTELTITPAEQASQIGIGLDTLIRVETPGSNPTQATLVKCLIWLST